MLRVQNRGQWFKEKQDLHINQVQLSAIKFAILAFAKMWKMSAIHNQVDEMIALSYLLNTARKTIFSFSKSS